MDFFEFSDYPREERLELLRAMEATTPTSGAINSTLG